MVFFIDKRLYFKHYESIVLLFDFEDNLVFFFQSLYISVAFFTKSITIKHLRANLIESMWLRILLIACDALLQGF